MRVSNDILNIVRYLKQQSFRRRCNRTYCDENTTNDKGQVINKGFYTLNRRNYYEFYPGDTMKAWYDYSILKDGTSLLNRIGNFKKWTIQGQLPKNY